MVVTATEICQLYTLFWQHRAILKTICFGTCKVSFIKLKERDKSFHKQVASEGLLTRVFISNIYVRGSPICRDKVYCPFEISSWEECGPSLCMGGECSLYLATAIEMFHNLIQLSVGSIYEYIKTEFLKRKKDIQRERGRPCF